MGTIPIYWTDVNTGSCFCVKISAGLMHKSNA